MLAELLCRSNFSFLRGASHPEELILQAQKTGLSALGLADMDGVYGLAKAYDKAKDFEEFKLIYGAELSLASPRDLGSRGTRLGLVLHAKSKKGWSLLCRLITASHAGRPKGEALLPWAEFLSLAGSGNTELLALPRWEESQAPTPWGPLHEIFGQDLLLPLCRVLDGKDAERTRYAKEQEARYGLKVVASNDVHAHLRERQALQDSLVCIREGLPLKEAGYRLFPNAERYLKGAAEMEALFADWPQCLEAGLAAAESCNFTLKELRYHYPSEWLPAGMDAQAYLEQMTWQGAAGKFSKGLDEPMRQTIAHELKLIAELGFADYFLTIEDIVHWARDQKILCQGRGSAANSVVCYCLGITSVDPSKIDLLFERFLSVERAEPPDIDVDFEHERREEVIQQLYKKYTRDRAAMVSAVITYRSRSSIAELSKALDRPVRVGRSLRDIDMADYEPQVQALSEQIAGFPRHISIHSGGFVLSDGPLADLVPIEPARMEGRTVVQWDKVDLDIIGMMKVDVLALGMLTALKRCMDLTGYADLAALPREDPKTYAMIQQADTIGVFQIESRAQMNMLGRLKPKDFYDLVIEVAIVRPGPIHGDMVHPYLKRRKGEEAVDFEHKKLIPILGKTLGVPLFQEQVMRIAVDLADFSPGDSDRLRRAIGAWRSDGRLSEIGGRLHERLRANGLSEAFCDRLFKEIKGFAEYGFPESHAASFAMLCYASSYLKCHHPAEFASSLINSQPMGFYANHSLVDDAKRHGVRVLPVHPNKSLWDCQMDYCRLQLGWRICSGLSEEAAKRLIVERSKRPFADLDDFVSRSGLKPAVLHSLALGNAFACFGLEPREALWRVLIMETFQQHQGPQLTLFSQLHPQEEGEEGPGFAALLPYEAVAEEYKSFGLSTKAHPMQVLRLLLKDLPPARTAEARKGRHGQWWTQAGLVIVRQRPGTAAGVVFATLEDESGLLDLVLHVEVYERFRELLLHKSFLCASGILQRDQDSVSLLLKNLSALNPKKALKTHAHNWH
jgi:error-prone DNA polymerase